MQEKREALFGSTATHAAFGDVEMAQVTLRGELLTDPVLIIACSG